MPRHPFPSSACAPCVALLSVAALVGCSDHASAGTGGDAKSAGAAEPGVIKGTAKTQDGEPLPSFGGYISGTSAKSGGLVVLNPDGKDGVYKANVGPGQFASRMWTDVTYHDHKYRIDLDPVDGKGGLVKQDTTDGIIKDFVWKLDGWRAGKDERTDDRYYGHHGGSVQLSGEGLGTLYRGDIQRNYGAKQEPPLAKDSTIELTLTPDGPLIDGSTGKPVVFAVKLGDVSNYMDRIKRGIPIGAYKATAVEVTAGGARKPLRVVQFYGGIKDKPTEPAASLPLLFVQNDPPSDNVNKVEEVRLHVLY